MTENAVITQKANGNTPPLLLLAALAFWGWQSGLLIFGIVMGVVLESSRFIKLRFEFSAVDFRRIRDFCGLLGLALVFYAFTSDEEIGGIGNLLRASPSGQSAVVSGLHAATIVPRWLPIILFLLIAAQNFSEVGSIPLSAISMVFQWRQRAAGGVLPEKHLNIAYPYLILCVFSAGIHANDGAKTYFWGQCVLVAWALWPLRSRRFHAAIWLGALVLAMALAYAGNRGMAQLEELAQGFNAQWMARLVRQRTDPMHTMTAIGQIGELKLSSTIVIRLETPAGASPPTYLRQASYHTYHSQAWYAGSPQNDFQDISPEVAGGDNYDLLPGETGNREVNIACYLDSWSSELKVPEGLLPLPTGCDRLENVPNSVSMVRKNRTGAVLIAGPGLVIFDARYGTAETFDSPPDTNWDLGVPTNEIPALEQTVAELKLTGDSVAEKELAVARLFAGKFSYSTWQGPDKDPLRGHTPLGRFLLETHRGHCEYFATATVLLFRMLGIPARYAVGYYVHEANGDNHYVVRERDAHAWCLVWNEQAKVWQDFDTTPGSWVAAESRGDSILQSIKDFFSWLHFQFSKFRYGQTHLRQYILWTAGPVLFFLLYQIVFRRGRRRMAAKAGDQNAARVLWPGLDSEFYQVEKRLAARGVPRLPAEALGDWIERLLAEKSLAEVRDPLQELLQLHYRHRFDPKGLPEGERRLLAEKVRRLLQNLGGK
jgi:hypothetical protein